MKIQDILTPRSYSSKPVIKSGTNSCLSNNFIDSNLNNKTSLYTKLMFK